MLPVALFAAAATAGRAARQQCFARTAARAASSNVVSSTEEAGQASVVRVRIEGGATSSAVDKSQERLVRSAVEAAAVVRDASAYLAALLEDGSVFVKHPVGVASGSDGVAAAATSAAAADAAAAAAAARGAERVQLTQEQIKEMRALRAADPAKWGARALARHFNVSARVVGVFAPVKSVVRGGASEAASTAASS